MKLMTGILAVAMMTGAAWGQNPDAVDNTGSGAKSLQQTKTNQTKATPAPAGAPANPQTAKPVAGLRRSLRRVSRWRRKRPG